MERENRRSEALSDGEEAMRWLRGQLVWEDWLEDVRAEWGLSRGRVRKTAAGAAPGLSPKAA